MSDNDQEHELLRSAFADEHEALAEATPAFSKLWAAASGIREDRRRQRVRPWSAWAARAALAATATAAVLLVAAAAWMLAFPQNPSDAGWQEALLAVQEISDWQAPLDFLLETPGSSWLSESPTFTFELPHPPTHLQEVIQ